MLAECNDFVPENYLCGVGSLGKLHLFLIQCTLPPSTPKQEQQAQKRHNKRNTAYPHNSGAPLERQGVVVNFHGFGSISAL